MGGPGWEQGLDLPALGKKVGGGHRATPRHLPVSSSPSHSLRRAHSPPGDLAGCAGQGWGLEREGLPLRGALVTLL